MRLPNRAIKKEKKHMESVMENNGQQANHIHSAWQQNSLLAGTNRVLYWIEDTFNLLASYLVMGLMISSSAEIAGRYIFNRPIPGYVEIVELVLPVFVFLGISYAERNGRHVRMEIFIDKVLKGFFHHAAEVLNLTFSLFVYIVISIYSFKFFLQSLQAGDITTILYWPTWPAKLLVSIGCFILCIRFVFEIIQHVFQALKSTKGGNDR
jgi:C4-dicarboxylate transporter, DctQ subunit